MSDAYFEDHPTDPNKVILRKKPRIDQGADYERGFIDGMQYQMQTSVDKAVNRMAQPEQCKKEQRGNGEYVCNCKPGKCPELAQPEQEPVAWLYESPMPDGSIFVGASAERLTIGVGVTPDTKEIPLYPKPPQRTWVGLTEEQIRSLWNDGDCYEEIAFARAIEAKLKEKNT